MAFVSRFSLAVIILALAVPLALAGPNAGGVLVVHTGSVVFSDGQDYVGQSGVACGQDGPAWPQLQVCPPYDPIGGATPCVPTAANPTSPAEAGVQCVWWVLAAFPNDSCPRMKTVAFRFDYDKTKMTILAWGLDAGDFELTEISDIDDLPFPNPGSGTSVSFTSGTKTSLLQEVYWFAGYAYSGQTDVTFQLRGRNATDHYFIDDAETPEKDDIAGFGKLGLGGTLGDNPIPVPVPVENVSWGRIKHTYSTN